VKKKVPILNFARFVGTKSNDLRFNFFQCLFQKIHVVINWACPKPQRVKLSFLFMLFNIRPLNIVFKMYNSKPRNRYRVVDHYKNGHKTTILE